MNTQIKNLILQTKRFGIDAQPLDNGTWSFSDSKQAFEAVFSEQAIPESACIDTLFQLLRLHPDARASAFPDLHPSSKTKAPVGSALLLPYFCPEIIGSDVNCGMFFSRIDGLSADHCDSFVKTGAAKTALSEFLCSAQRDIPMSLEAFRALFNEGASACLDELKAHNPGGLWKQANFDVLQACARLEDFTGMPACSYLDAPEALVTLGKRELIRDPSLGTLGGGNHFAEFQLVDGLFTRRSWEAGLRKNELHIMIHTGSRAAGFYAQALALARIKAPANGQKAPFMTMAANEHQSLYALQAASAAARWAWLNRVVLAEGIVQKLQATFKKEISLIPIAQVAHNCATQEQGGILHRKGAARAPFGALIPIPGSMGDYSWIVQSLGSHTYLDSCSHGAGRSCSRGKAKHLRGINPSSACAVDLACLNPLRAQEEAPEHYRQSFPAIEAQAHAGLIEPIARLRPVVTFKA